jgi:hypothetical protein
VQLTSSIRPSTCQNAQIAASASSRSSSTGQSASPSSS